MFKTKTKLSTRVMSIFMSLLMAASMLTILMSVQPTEEVSAANDYGLADNIQDGVILHCFCWKYNDIKAMLPEIAEAGFTSVQTSPAQQGCGGDNGPKWYALYQPLGFYVGNNELGSKDDLKALCDEADKYGIKVIVDVVANHLAGDHSNIQNDLKDGQYWHHEDGGINYLNRKEIHQRAIGMPDINSEHEYVQQCVRKYLEELKSLGVDGIRWDAAKHIGLPSENCNFWPAVIDGIGLWSYGEILDDPVASDESHDNSSYANQLMKEYTKYISVTDSGYCANVRMAFRNGGIYQSIGNYSERGVSKDKLVYWAESHDTYSNNNRDGNWDSSQFIDQNKIDRAYAVVAAQSKATSLYFSRPSSTDKESIMSGSKGSTHFTSKEVAEVNRFHNAMIGQKEYDTSGDNCSVVCREKGAVIVAGNGGNRDVSVPNGGGIVAPGTYTDQVSGNTWTVTSTTISGKIGDTGIAVVYNPTDAPARGGVSATPATGTTFTTDTLSVTLGAKDVTNAKYTTSEGASGSYTDGQKITVGASTAVGGTVKVTLSGTKSDGSTATAEYTYTKKDQSAVTAIYFDNSSYNWSSVYAYIYTGDGASAKSAAAWPGTAMTKDSSTGYYKLDVPSGFENGRVIFTESADTTTNRYPADMEPGLEIGDSSKIFKAGNKWENYSSVITVTDPTVTSSQASGSSFTTETYDVTLGLANAVSGTYSVDNGPTKTFTTSTKVTIGEGKIGDSDVTIKATATNDKGTTKNYTFTYKKTYVKQTSKSVKSVSVMAAERAVKAASSSSLASYYKTNAVGKGSSKTITVDGDVSDWDSSMLIAQGAANDDPRVYRPNSMYEIPYDAYALYGAWDDTNLYLMIEMTNVQDVVAPNDTYPLGSNASVDNIPMFIYIDTGKSDAIGNNGKTQKDETLWSCNTTVTSSFNRVIAMSSGVGKNGPYIYGGDSTGINPVELGNSTTSGIVYKTGKGILSKEVWGINGAYGEYNNRVLGDMCSDSADWVDFNTKGHNSATMDYNYEVSIPLSQLGITKSDIESSGIGVLFVHSSGASGMDCIPYDITMNDNADQSDPASNPENSFEKGDEDNITTSFARIGNGSTPPPPPDPTLPLQVNFGADRSAPQEAGTALTLKGIGYGGSGSGYKYEFIVDGTTVQESSSKDSYTWNLTSGKHTIKCIITDSKGATATSSKTYTAEGGSDPDLPLTNNSIISATSITKGQSITMTAKATGGKAPYTYTYLCKSPSSSNYATLATTSSTSYKHTPANAGTYSYQVKVVDANGSSKVKSFSVKVSAPATELTNKSVISATSIKLGTTIKLTGKAIGGTTPYKYTYFCKPEGSAEWATIKSISTSTSCTHKPARAITYSYAVRVTDAKGESDVKYFTVKVSAPATELTNKSVISATSIKLGTTIKITGKAIGGTTPYKYTYFCKPEGSAEWATIKSISTSTSCTHKPARAITYNYGVRVTDAKGESDVKYFTVKVTKPATALTNNSTISATSIKLGSSVKMTAKATGGTAPYTYKYYCRPSTSADYIALTGSTKATTFTHKPARAITYNYAVKVADSKGATKTKYFTVKVTKPATALTNNSTISATSVKLGSSVKMTAKATGGTAPYTYKYYCRPSTSSKYTALTVSTTTATFTHKPARAITYNYAVKIADSKGATKTKYFTVTVK